MPSYLVTGAGRGLGYALVKTLASETSNIVLALVRDKAATEARLSQDNVYGVHLLGADITDQGALQAVASQAKDILGDSGLDVLINNAAYVSQVTALTSLHDYERELKPVIDDIQKSIEVNVLGSLKATWAFLDLVKKSQLKKIVMISSGMGDTEMINEIKLSNAAPYAISKGALNVLVSKLHASYADQGILFMGICPGLVDTAEVPPPHMPPEALDRLEGIVSKFEKYVGGKYSAMQPDEAAGSVLAAISRQTLSGGFGGTLRSHNGTRRWM